MKTLAPVRAQRRRTAKHVLLATRVVTDWRPPSCRNLKRPKELRPWQAQLVGDNPTMQQREAATRVAEAQFDIARIRRARATFISPVVLDGVKLVSLNSADKKPDWRIGDASSSGAKARWQPRQACQNVQGIGSVRAQSAVAAEVRNSRPR